jgi:hypothetical protein
MASDFASSNAARPGSLDAERPGRRHAKGRESRAKPAILAEEFGVGGIGARIAAFDVVDAQVVQHRSNRKLVREGEVDTIGLGAVAQGRVEKIKAFACHCLHHR